ncbi:MAG: hypothetical protein QM499_10935 [Flavobacteriaceae bacterium]
MKSFILLLVSIIIISCGNNSEEKTEIITPQKTNNSLYGDVNFNFPSLTENAITEVMHWGAFEDFETQVKSINGNSIKDVKIKSKQLISQLDSLTKKIPDTLYTKSIYSRVIVVKTRANLLNQEVNKAQFDSARLQNYFYEMNVSVKNLIIQINEKLQKDAIDFQRIDNEKQELEIQKKFLDSVYKSELKDQKNKL